MRVRTPVDFGLMIRQARRSRGMTQQQLARAALVWARRFQVSARSAFSLLSATGEDCPGAVQFARPERAGALLASGPREVVWLTTADVEARLRTLRSDNSA